VRHSRQQAARLKASIALGALGLGLLLPFASRAAYGVGPGVTRSVTCGTGLVCADGRIQAAIDESSSGDTVLVYPGTYREFVNFDGKSVSVISADGPGVTAIDGADHATTVVFDDHERPGALLQGFTVEHGDPGGISIGAGASPTIRNDVITANEACADGAGIEIDDGAPLISHNTISGNVAVGGCWGYVPGGGIYADGGAATIVGNEITDNAMDAGAGIAVVSGRLTIEDNVIEDNNDLGSGGSSGLELFDSQSGTTITQNLVANNDGTGASASAVRIATLGPIVFTDNTVVADTEDYAVWIDSNSAPPSLINNIIAGGTATPLACGPTYPVNPYLSHNDLSGASGPTGVCNGLVFANANLWAPPQFVNASALDFAEQPSSPTVDAGETADAVHPFTLPLTDLAGKPRTHRGSVDIGAFEYETPA
jgi:hypothetical protein